RSVSPAVTVTDAVVGANDSLATVNSIRPGATAMATPPSAAVVWVMPLTMTSASGTGIASARTSTRTVATGCAKANVLIATHPNINEAMRIAIRGKADCHWARAGRFVGR